MRTTHIIDRLCNQLYVTHLMRLIQKYTTQNAFDTQTLLWGENVLNRVNV